jgi:hypothetical protein
MNFLKQPTAKRELVQKLGGLVYGTTIVVHLPNLMAALRGLMTSAIRFEFQDFS